MNTMTTTDTTGDNGATPIRGRRAQQSIPGTEVQTIPAVEEAAIAYRDCRDRRMAMQVEEEKLQEALVDVMGKHEVEVYKFEDDGKKFVAKVKHKIKATVRTEKPDADASEDS